jgi:chromosome segregation ATPase
MDVRIKIGKITYKYEYDHLKWAVIDQDNVNVGKIKEEIAELNEKLTQQRQKTIEANILHGAHEKRINDINTEIRRLEGLDDELENEVTVHYSNLS